MAAAGRKSRNDRIYVIKSVEFGVVCIRNSFSDELLYLILDPIAFPHTSDAARRENVPSRKRVFFSRAFLHRNRAGGSTLYSDLQCQLDTLACNRSAASYF